MQGEKTWRSLMIAGHTLCLEGAEPLLDGQPFHLLTLEPERLVLACSGTTVELGTDQFWRTIAGGEPSASEAGMLLAQSLAQRVRIAQLQQVLQHLAEPSSVLDIVLLPTYRLDAVTRQVLAGYDGTEATTGILARILGQPPKTICTWAEQLGLACATAEPHPTTEPLSVESQPAVSSLAASSEEVPVASQVEPGESAAKRFLWTEDRFTLLKAAFEASNAPSVAAAAREIADRYAWPFAAVSSKLYYAGLVEKQQQARAREAAASDTKEED